MKELTPEQNEAAIILKSLWNQEKQKRRFTQQDAAAQLDLPQPYISKLLAGKEALGPATVAKFAKFLNVRPSAIMPNLAYLDQRGYEVAALDATNKHSDFAPLLTRKQAEEWLAGSLTCTDLPDSTARIPLFEDWRGRRCFAVRANHQDAAANSCVTSGDVLVCDPTRRPGAGELAFYEIAGDWVLGTLQRHAGRWLLTFDPFDPVPIEDEDGARISAVIATYRLSAPALPGALSLPPA